MLLNEIVIDFKSRQKKKAEVEDDVEIPDTIGAPKSDDEMTNRRRAKMKPSDQLRDFVKQRQLRDKNKSK